MRYANFVDVDVTGLDAPRDSFQNIVWKAYNRTGVATIAGRLYAFDTHLATVVETVVNSENVKLPAVTDYSRGPNGAYGNIIAVATAAQTVAQSKIVQCCIALSAVADNELLDVLVCGVTNARLTFSAASTAYVAGTPIVPGIGVSTAPASDLVVVSGSFSNVKCLGMTLASLTSVASTDAQTVSVYFNGINGAFGDA